MLRTEQLVVPRISDVRAVLPSLTGKFELEYEGELAGAEKVAHVLSPASLELEPIAESRVRRLGGSPLPLRWGLAVRKGEGGGRGMPVRLRRTGGLTGEWGMC